VHAVVNGTEDAVLSPHESSDGETRRTVIDSVDAGMLKQLSVLDKRDSIRYCSCFVTVMGYQQDGRRQLPTDVTQQLVHLVPQ